MMNFNFDPDMMMNAMMLNEKSMAPIITVLNNYGIFGTKAMTFLMELGVACSQLGGGQNAEG